MSIGWSAPIPETSLFTNPFSRTFTLAPESPLITGCPTIDPKSVLLTPSKLSMDSPML